MFVCFSVGVFVGGCVFVYVCLRHLSPQRGNVCEEIFGSYAI